MVLISSLLVFGGAVIILAGLVCLARPIAAIGLGNRKRAAVAALAGFYLASGGIALGNPVCDRKIPCNPCSANRLPPISEAAGCLPPPLPRGISG
jgi:hypothetical protein